MSSYNNQQETVPTATPLQPNSYPPVFVAPLPAGYPMKDAAPANQQQVPVVTKSRSDGFWKGCCAALCCCCVLESCF